MLYRSQKKDFKHHVHPRLQRRIRIFLVIFAIGVTVVIWDMYSGSLGWWVALLAILVGGAIGFMTSRIFHLSWSRDANQVIGQIDTIGWFVLAGYIVFEVARALLFQTVVHTGYDPDAITYAFVAAAMAGRVFGLRGRILTILRNERVFG